MILIKLFDKSNIIAIYLCSSLEVEFLNYIKKLTT